MDGILVDIRVYAFHRRGEGDGDGIVTDLLLPSASRTVEVTTAAPWAEPWHGINFLREAARDGLDRALEDYDHMAHRFAMEAHE